MGQSVKRILIALGMVFMLLPIGSAFAFTITQTNFSMPYPYTNKGGSLVTAGADMTSFMVVKSLALNSDGTPKLYRWKIVTFTNKSPDFYLYRNPSNNLLWTVNGSVTVTVYRSSTTSLTSEFGDFNVFVPTTTYTNGQTIHSEVSTADMPEEFPRSYTGTSLEYGIVDSIYNLDARSETGQPIFKDYQLHLSSSSHPENYVAPYVFYKNEDIYLNSQDYQKLVVYLDGNYLSQENDEVIPLTRWNILTYSDWSVLDKENIIIEVRAYPDKTKSDYQTYTFPIQLKKDLLNPVGLGEDDDPTDGSWFDDIKQPTPPDNAWDLIGWVKYIAEWIVYLVKITIGMLASFGQSVANLMGQVNGFVEVLSAFFAFMPAQIGALFGIGVTLVIILAVLRRG